MSTIRTRLILCVIGLCSATHALAGPFQWPFGNGPTEMTGRSIYRSRCGGCHALDHDKYGPSHHDVFGRIAGTQPGYHYSAALARSGVVWNETSLDRWLSDPRAMIPGTKMSGSVRDPAQRRMIIDFLRGRPAPDAN